MNPDNRSTGVTVEEHQVLWSMQTGDGASVAVCGQRHGQELWLERRERDPEVRLRQSRDVMSEACLHCGWCGELVAAPLRCTLHAGRDCPEFDALSAEPVQGSVALVTAWTGSVVLPEAFWDHLPSVVGVARARGQLEGRAVAELMWGLRDVWLTSGSHRAA